MTLWNRKQKVDAFNLINSRGPYHSRYLLVDMFGHVFAGHLTLTDIGDVF